MDERMLRYDHPQAQQQQHLVPPPSSTSSHSALQNGLHTHEPSAVTPSSSSFNPLQGFHPNSSFKAMLPAAAMGAGGTTGGGGGGAVSFSQELISSSSQLTPEGQLKRDKDSIYESVSLRSCLTY